jgi:hypothetical protein
VDTPGPASTPGGHGKGGRCGRPRAGWSAGTREHLAQLDPEVDNFHAALGWAIGQASAERALAPVAALGWYWMIRDRYADAVAWVNQAVSLPGADAHPALCVHALRAKNLGLWLLGRASAQPATLAKAEAIARALGDPEVLSRALQDRVDHEAARRADLAAGLADEALACARGSHFKRPRCGRSKRPRRPRKGDACERRAWLPAVRPRQSPVVSAAA